ncbi:glutathione S-transferase 1 isoform X2 [Dendroctonus ponderosae]|uniref:Glutathione S-transferase n=1 Tax=Dendroctonus ponderosae TaxID=77166 RepID=J3JWM0_DENPD|nr:glutathione S-transferase 1 isoform X2 [Dendroctonus ponderosae]AEE62600.1 unknown [Dendroctonus ponderosae]
MAPTLYMSEISPSCRAVLMTARILGLTLKVKKIDLSKNEQFTPHFLKINPQHTIPTLIDNGYAIWDSHAIIAFLIGKYGVDDELYSSDIMERALIDQRLHFDSSVVNNFTRTILNPMLYENVFIDVDDYKDSIYKTYSIMEKFLRSYPWIAGKKLTVADLSLIPSITSLDVIVPIKREDYPNLKNWMERAEHLPCYIENENGLNLLRDMLQKKCCCPC